MAADGVNSVPSLKAASIDIAIGSGLTLSSVRKASGVKSRMPRQNRKRRLIHLFRQSSRNATVHLNSLPQSDAFKYSEAIEEQAREDTAEYSHGPADPVVRGYQVP